MERAFLMFTSGRKVRASTFSRDSHGDVVADYMKNLSAFSERHWKSLLTACGLVEAQRTANTSGASTLECVRDSLYIPSSPWRSSAEQVEEKHCNCWRCPLAFFIWTVLIESEWRALQSHATLCFTFIIISHSEYIQSLFYSPFFNSMLQRSFFSTYPIIYYTTTCLMVNLWNLTTCLMVNLQNLSTCVLAQLFKTFKTCLLASDNQTEDLQWFLT